MIMATHRIWSGVNGSGIPASGAKNTVRMAPSVVDNWKRMNLMMLS